MENDKTYLLNIQQQVRKNQIEIELLKSGIKIVGAGETLPASANEGDCYLLGTDNDYGLNAYINGNWIPLGSFPAVGPQGVPGVKGDPAVISYITCAARAIDYGLAPHVSASVNGETVSFDFELPGGPRGLQGPKGEKGDKGDQGNVGPQGPQGEPGNSIRLFQNPSVVTASDLPAASVVGAGVGYLVGTYGTGYELYVTANDPLEWVDAGPFIPTQVTVDPKLDRLSENAVENKPVAKAIGMPATFSVTAAVAQGLILTDHFDDIYTNGYPFSAVDGGTRQKYLSFRESIGGGGTGRSYDYVSFSYNIYGLSVSSAMVVASSVGLTDSASVSAVDNFVVPKRSELLSVKNSLNAEIARSNAADDLHQKEITLLKNLVYDTVAASYSYSADYVFWMDVPASVEVSGSYHDVLDDAAAQIEDIEGTSVAWNQLMQNPTFSNGTSNWSTYHTTLTVSSGVASVTASAQGGDLYQLFPTVEGHKYLILFNVKFTTYSNDYGFYFGSGGGLSQSLMYANSTSWQTVSGILTANSTLANGAIEFKDERASDWDAVQFRKIIVIDLTKDFPTDTPTTLDDPRIQAILSNPDIDYDAGSIKSSTVDEVISHGFNMFDKSTAELDKAVIADGTVTNSTGNACSDYIRVLPNTMYYFTKIVPASGANQGAFYDANKNFISKFPSIYPYSDDHGLQETPSNAAFIRFNFNKNAIDEACVSKSNVSMNGQYKPWVAPMSVDLAALGVPLSKRKLMSAGTARDRIYAVMQPDETYQLRRTGRVGSVDLSTLTYSYSAWVSSDHKYFIASKPADCKGVASGYTKANILCNKYVADTGNTMETNYDTVDKAIAIIPGNLILIKDSSLSSTDTPTGILYYELEEPIDELLAEGLTFGDLELLIEKGGYLSIDGDGDSYGAIPGLTVDLPILRYE